MLWAAAQPGAFKISSLSLGLALIGASRLGCKQRLDAPSLYSRPPLHSAIVHRRRRAFTRSTLLQQRRRAAAMPKRVQAKRRLRTTATLTLWAAVQPGAFSDCALRLLACLNWRLALLIGTLAAYQAARANAKCRRVISAWRCPSVWGVLECRPAFYNSKHPIMLLWCLRLFYCIERILNRKFELR